ncbi:MAG: RNA polymerase sigma factor [Gemmatimonadaceae bacterium]
MALHLNAVDDAIANLQGTIARGLAILTLRHLNDADDARDATQEILARALAAIREGRVPPGVQLGAFVYGIARHVIADAIKRRTQAASRAVLEPSAHSPLEALIEAEELLRLRRALARLEPAERALLTAHYVDGLQLVELAARSGEPPERLRKQKSRAIARLRTLLGEGGGGGGGGGGTIGHVSRQAETYSR